MLSLEAFMGTGNRNGNRNVPRDGEWGMFLGTGTGNRVGLRGIAR